MDKEEVFFVDKENNYIKWLLIMAIFIGLLALGTYVYYKLTPKNIFESVISKIDFESSDKSSTSEQVKFAKRYDFSYNAYSDNKDIEQLLVILNKYKYRLDLYYNNENEVRFEADLTFNDKKLLNLLFGYDEKMTYVGAYDRTYYFENLDNISEEEQVKYEENKSKFDKFLDELNDENDLNDKFFKPVVDAFKNSVEDYNLKRTVSKDNIVLTITYDNKFYKIILVGKCSFNIDENKILDLVNIENIIRIKNHTQAKYEIEEIANQVSLKGLFAKRILEKIQNTEDEQEKNRLISAFDVGIDVLSK